MSGHVFPRKQPHHTFLGAIHVSEMHCEGEMENELIAFMTSISLIAFWSKKHADTAMCVRAAAPLDSMLAVYIFAFFR